MITFLSLLIALLSLIIIIAISIWYTKTKRKNKNKISFFESLNLVGLPVITMQSNNKTINFLLDTGSNKSFIDSRIIDELDSSKIENKTAFVTGINNKSSETVYYLLKLKYKDNAFVNEFQSFNFEKSFGHIMEKTGIRIDGIIGGDFLKKYKYIINYEEFFAYNK